MADDDRYRWLDRAAAERLLSGEPLEASLTSAGPEARDQAERLAKTLDALSVDPARSDAELPGEAAALAAFRKARPAPDLTAVAPATATPPASDIGSDMGLVRVGGSRRSGASPQRRVRAARWGRPLRLGLGAALAAGMAGSVAMAAGVGVLPNPFGGDAPGSPAATVSAAESRDPMLGSPSPDGTRGKSIPTPRPDGTPGGSFGNGSPAPGESWKGPADGGRGSRSDMGLPGDWRGGLASSCRDMRSGKKLAAERRQALEKAAKGAKKVPQYCDNALKDDPSVHSNADTGTGAGTGSGKGDTGAGDNGGQNGAGDNGGQGNGAGGSSNGGGGGNGHGAGNGNGNGGSHGGRAATRPTPTPTSFTALGSHKPQDDPAPAAAPSYGVLPLPTAT
ncbi:hypothetical protein ACKI1I_18570 [Streptomyces turgidiscabies]|uniref:Extensin n=1 Tax=Streptomyces turgidiscabies (strain Car8) TaxID=698760 RepID=L7ERN4_STRT8|nr:hypothetical protein [Streptomyces turgidiscabies]ELP61672.1 hypothetical protein STRTUCAR8_06978 [Streptomyces turgidiscabies Car8]MDX3497879.1 hypothetical protein [Streptomyces turgidiscabies]GAQ69785.1 hypothetical protein T45_01516 [Streptomyces turgidiscabies]